MRWFSLKLRLLLIVAGILMVGLVTGGGIMLHNARQATLEEIEANLDFSRQLVAFLIADSGGTRSRADIERLSRAFRDLRHVQVAVKTKEGRWRPLTPDPASPSAPDWFSRLIVPPAHAFPDVEIRDWGDANIRIQATARDEVVEVWSDVSGLFPVVLVLLLVVCGLVYAGLWAGLAPIRDLHNGFHRLEENDFGVRLKGPAVPELADTQRRFNHLAEVLQQSVAERRALTRRLVHMQEEERRTIARELHDEMAPHLFGLRSELSGFLWSIQAGQTGDAATRARSMQKSLELLQQQVRKMLNRMRPPVLDDLGLIESLGGLVDDWRRRHPDVDWRMPHCDVGVPLDDAVQVTVYRAVQECLTNIARHADACRADVRLWTETDPQPQLRVEVRDDGSGVADSVRPGLGLSGLQERVAALGGQFEIRDAPGGGLVVALHIPLMAG